MIKELNFITSNENKFKEAIYVIPYLKQVSLELIEIQELDPIKIIEFKLEEAKNKYSGNLIVEDTSLYINSLNGFPGPLIKWFLKSLGNDGIYNLIKDNKDKSAYVICKIGVFINNKIKFFEGRVEGTIVNPLNTDGFGWNPIFKPLNSDQTFAQMSIEKKVQYSMRTIAFNKLKEYLD